MINVLKNTVKELLGISFQTQKQNDEQLDNDAILALIKQVKLELQNADINFDAATDADLAEVYIYQRKAAEAKYKYLLRLAKEKNIYESHKRDKLFLLGHTKTV